MIVTTKNEISGKQCEELGLVQGNIVYCANIGRDLMASFKNIKGGEIKSYTKMTSDARQTAEERVIEAATAMGADAIVAARFSCDTVAQGTIEMLCYGTAVKFV